MTVSNDNVCTLIKRGSINLISYYPDLTFKYLNINWNVKRSKVGPRLKSTKKYAK